jgi:hypothetical protein
MRNLLRGVTAALALAVLPLAANAGVFIGVSVNVAPPALPVYVAPPMPAPGYFWTPGYWAYGEGGYYWVPGTWVMAPAVGLLWTPGYWGWGGGAYAWHAGYWGPHVGFYGGINYGFGYGGVGFAGGGWQGGRYVANTTVINNTTVVNNTTVINRTSFNGGTGGVVATPNAAEQRYAQEQHVAPSEVQQQHEQAASRDMTMRADYNHGSPSVAATAKAGQFYGHGVTSAHAGNFTPAHTGGTPGAPTAHAPLSAQSNHAGVPAQGHGGSPYQAPHGGGGYPNGAHGANYPHSQGHGGEHQSQPHPEHGRPG